MEGETKVELEENNYVIPKNAMDFALKLFENSAKETAKNGEWLMSNYQKQIEELKSDLNISNLYIDYVQKCVKLQVVPRNYGYWYVHIREDYDALFGLLD